MFLKPLFDLSAFSYIFGFDLEFLCPLFIGSTHPESPKKGPDTSYWTILNLSHGL